jgi:hypothetical protein
MRKYECLVIDYASPYDLENVVTVEYRLFNYDIVERWINQVEQAVAQYPIDNPERFYGFESLDQAVESALADINKNISTINSYSEIITRTLTTVHDQDTLNYLHSIFEQYHGLLDSQYHRFWKMARPEVQQALAELNVNVHRCESIARGNPRRQVTTWYGLPKTQTLDEKDYKIFTDQYVEGCVYLNYVEIGKTFENLAEDRDKYIGDNAFRPFQHFSADFTVKFYTVTDSEIAQRRQQQLEFYNQHRDFFYRRGLDIDSPEMRPGSIPLAATNQDVASLIKNYLYVKKVSFK